MADISKCNSNTCPLRMACYRFTCKSNEHHQSYTTFKYNPITKECRGFYQDLKAKQLADMFSAKLIDNSNVIMKTQYWNPNKEQWVDKLPKSFANKLVKTRQIPNN